MLGKPEKNAGWTWLNMVEHGWTMKNGWFHGISNWGWILGISKIGIYNNYIYIMEIEWRLSWWGFNGEIIKELSWCMDDTSIHPSTVYDMGLATENSPKCNFNKWFTLEKWRLHQPKLWFHQQKLCCDQQTSWFQRPNWKFSMKSRDWNQLQRILLDQCVPWSTYMGCCKHYDLSLSGAALNHSETDFLNQCFAGEILMFVP